MRQRLIAGGALLCALFIVFLAKGAFAQSPNNEKAVLLFGNSYSEQKIPAKKIFAKALAGFLEIKLGKTTSCYKDLKKKDETSKAVCALKKAKIFTGSNKSKFYPNKKTDWGAAIKSLCKAKNWTKEKTFAACTAFARSSGFLSPPLPSKIRSKEFVKYGELALLFERMEKGAQNTQQPALSPPAPAAPAGTTAVNAVFNQNIPPRKTFAGSVAPVAQRQIPRDFFANITLSEPLPNYFYLDEVYFIEGDVLNSATDEVFAFLCRENQNCDDSVDFVEETNGSHFKIPVHFSEAGNFRLGIIPGQAGQSRIVDISVLPEPPLSAATGEQATNLSYKYDSGKTTFSWNGNGSLARLIFFQGQERRDYIFRQGVKSFAPQSKDFAAFKKGSAGWLVAQDASQSPVQQINLTVQEFHKIETDEIQIKNLQDVFKNPGHFIFTAKSLAPISKKAAITLPNGKVDEIEIAQDDIDEQTDFRIETNLETSGTYIFEVNTPLGNAVVNVPIYVGEAAPLLPDFFSLHTAALDSAPLPDLNQARQKLLKLINADRRANGLAEVSLSQPLNEIAQSHSQNMVEQNFFGHVDPAGFGPEERRKRAKYPAPIEENLGKASSLEFVEAGLMRSPIHRAAILDPKMTRVGIGIVKDSDGYFFVTQNFSADPLQTDNLPALENTLFQEANNFRANQSLAPLANDDVLREVTSQWSSRMAVEGFFGTTDSQNKSVMDVARARGVKSSIHVHIIKTSDKEGLNSELTQQTGLQDASNKKIGIGLGLNDIGEIFMTVLYTP